MNASPSPLTLLVMAAGMGSRYGGLKQVEGFGRAGETILEFSLFDAYRAGFERCVLVIRPELEATFRERILRRLPKSLEVAFAYQELSTELPAGLAVPEGRTKPWGTGHATLVARSQIDGPFAVINADDFYGRGAYVALADFFRGTGARNPSQHALVGYALRRTLSPNGGVARGIVTTGAQDRLERVVEHTDIRQEADGPVRGLPQGSTQRVSLDADAPASMNVWGFQAGFFEALERGFAAFAGQLQDPLKDEFYLPAAVDQMVRAGGGEVQLVRTDEDWFGVTYPEDRPAVLAAIERRVAAGEYPTPLWAG
ncbi:MAG: NDP-sugar synthase [Opitutales bacterium]